MGENSCTILMLVQLLSLFAPFLFSTSNQKADIQ